MGRGLETISAAPRYATHVFGVCFLDQKEQRVLEVLVVVEAGRSLVPAPPLNFLQEFERSGPVFIGGFEGECTRVLCRDDFSLLRVPADFERESALLVIHPAAPDDHLRRKVIHRAARTCYLIAVLRVHLYQGERSGNFTSIVGASGGVVASCTRGGVDSSGSPYRNLGTSIGLGASACVMSAR